MIKNDSAQAEKDQAQKDLTEFRDQLHELLCKYPNIRLCVDTMNYPNILAYIPSTLTTGERAPRVQLPRMGVQE